jgi:RNA methyltransferase, TrmH family
LYLLFEVLVQENRATFLPCSTVIIFAYYIDGFDLFFRLSSICAILLRMQQNSPHNPVSSRENSVVKHLRSLADAKVRKKERAFLLEGPKLVEEALRDNREVLLVAASPSLLQRHGKGILKLAESRAVKILWISDRLMDAISESKTPQPVLAVARMKLFSEADLLDSAAGLLVIGHQLQDPGNLGTIIRTAEAAGAAGVAVTAGTVDFFNSKTIRASMGSILRLPVVQVGDVVEFIQACRRKNYQTVAAVTSSKQTHFDIDLKKPTAVILGQEGAGLPPDILSHVNGLVRIPMSEAIDSLNVSIAAAIILYEAVRQRSLSR